MFGGLVAPRARLEAPPRARVRAPLFRADCSPPAREAQRAGPRRGAGRGRDGAPARPRRARREPAAQG